MGWDGVELGLNTKCVRNVAYAEERSYNWLQKSKE